MSGRRKSVKSILSRESNGSGGSTGSDMQSMDGLTDKLTVTKNVKTKKGTRIDDNRLHSFVPAGIPKSDVGQHNSFVYKWDKMRGKEHNARDPINKPLTIPIDDAYLSILPKKSADSAWHHLQSNKKRPSLEDYSDTPEIAAAAAATKKVMATETLNPRIMPFEIEPKQRAVGPRPDPVIEPAKMLPQPRAKNPMPEPVVKPLRAPNVKPYSSPCWAACPPPPCPSLYFPCAHCPFRTCTSYRTNSYHLAEPSHPFYIPDQRDYNMYARPIRILSYKTLKPVSRCGTLTTRSRPVKVECFRPWKP